VETHDKQTVSDTMFTCITWCSLCASFVPLY